MANHSPPPFPPAPWRLVGSALAVAGLVDKRVAARYLPDGVKPVTVWPGKTLGGWMVATYSRGSTLEYHELIVFCGIVRHGLRVGGWISHIYVDHPASVAGGCEIWGLPKEFAEFRLEDRKVAVSQGNRSLFHAERPATGPGAPFPIWLPAWGRRNGRPDHFVAAGRGRIAITRVSLAIPAGSPLAGILHSGSRLALAIPNLRVSVSAPVDL